MQRTLLWMVLGAAITIGGSGCCLVDNMLCKSRQFFCCGGCGGYSTGCSGCGCGHDVYAYEGDYGYGGCDSCGGGSCGDACGCGGQGCADDCCDPCYRGNDWGCGCLGCGEKVKLDCCWLGSCGCDCEPCDLYGHYMGPGPGAYGYGFYGGAMSRPVGHMSGVQPGPTPAHGPAPSIRTTPEEMTPPEPPVEAPGLPSARSRPNRSYGHPASYQPNRPANYPGQNIQR